MINDRKTPICIYNMVTHEEYKSIKQLIEIFTVYIKINRIMNYISMNHIIYYKFNLPIYFVKIEIDDK